MKKQFLISIFLLSANLLFAQSDFKAGYIITNQMDTVWGLGNISKKQDYCIFQPYNKNDHNKYYPDKIFGFRILKGRYYLSKQVGNDWLFLEYLVDGELDLYVLREKGGNERFFIEKDDLPLKEILYGKEDLVYKDGTSYIQEDKKYLGLMKVYMQDSPEMLTEIEKVDVIKQKSLIQLAEDYHNSVCFDRECINYTKTIPKVSLKLEPFTGVNYHNDFYTPQYGIFLNIWRPLKNEKLYFKIGLSYSSLPGGIRSDSTYSGSEYKINIPFYWQYVFGEGKIKPTFGVGFINGKLETSLQTGLIYALSDNFELTVNGSIDSILKLVTNLNREYYNNNFGHSIMIGCQIKMR